MALRILQVSAHYPPFLGGIANHIQEVSRRLAAWGEDVTVITADPTGQLPPEEANDGVRVLRARSWPAREDFFFTPGITRLIANGGPWDVLHCQGSHTFVPPIAMAAAARLGVPFAVTFHTGVHSSAVRNRLRPLEWKLLRPLFAKADRFVGVSSYEARYFAEQLNIAPGRFTVIPNGADFPSMPPANRPAGTAPTIVTIGRLERYKGHHRVIEALPGVLHALPDVRLRILGSGPYEPVLRRLAARLGVADRVRIELIPPEEREQLAQALAEASLVVLLSEGESHPLAVLEAASLGCSILVSDDGMGNTELAMRGLARMIPLSSTPAMTANAIVDQMLRPFHPAPVVLPTWDDCAHQLLALYYDIARVPLCAS